MDKEDRKRIVLFGVSANPPTGLQGHMGIVKYFSRWNYGVCMMK